MSEKKQKTESWDKPSGFPSIATLNRRAAEKKDMNEKRRYFQSLLVKLDGEIGEQRQTFNELLRTGELVDPEEPKLRIERMEMLRAHAARLREQLGREEGGQPAPRHGGDRRVGSDSRQVRRTSEAGTE